MRSNNISTCYDSVAGVEEDAEGGNDEKDVVFVLGLHESQLPARGRSCCSFAQMYERKKERKKESKKVYLSSSRTYIVVEITAGRKANQ